MNLGAYEQCCLHRIRVTREFRIPMSTTTENSETCRGRINLTYRISDSIKPVYYGGRTTCAIFENA